jgi:hypothetical protein
MEEPMTESEWIFLCALRLQELGSLIDDVYADELAADLHRCWPQLAPAAAANRFIHPDTSAGS